MPLSPILYCDTRLGNLKRWHLGSPKDAEMRVPEDIRDCVCFLCVRSWQAGREVFQYGGTAFFVAVLPELAAGEIMHIYLMTARHNMEKARQIGNLFLRMNTANGDATLIEVEADWHYPENDASDVAVLPWAPSRTHFDYKPIHPNMFATDSVIAEYAVGIGDELLVTGLFSGREGTQRNLPIVRTGIIASMPDEPLIDHAGREYRAYLAEVRSIGGLSGSPVFVFLEPGREHGGKIDMSGKAFLLGLIRGHWDYRRRDAPFDFVGSELDAVNMGMAIVTPIQDALEVINSQEFVKMRRKGEREYVKEKAPAQDMADKESPATRDEFFDDLKKVSRRRKPA